MTIPLGRPGRAVHRVIGAVIGIPVGIGIAVPPHGLLLGIGGAAYATYVAASILLATRSVRRFNTENSLAVGALGRGELANAHDVFARWARSRVVTISAVARHNLGWTLMLEGRLEEAARILEDAAEHYHRALTRNALLPTTRVDAALCHVLLGNLDRAETWCTRSAQPVKGPPRPSFPGMMALARAFIDCRTGRAREASVLLEHAWTEHEATMTGETLRMMRVARAFACAAADGPRNQGMVERMLGDMTPRYECELAFLGTRWPEMATFLAAHHLDG